MSDRREAEGWKPAGQTDPEGTVPGVVTKVHDREEREHEIKGA